MQMLNFKKIKKKKYEIVFFEVIADYPLRYKRILMEACVFKPAILSEK